MGRPFKQCAWSRLDENQTLDVRNSTLIRVKTEIVIDGKANGQLDPNLFYQYTIIN